MTAIVGYRFHSSFSDLLLPVTSSPYLSAKAGSLSRPNYLDRILHDHSAYNKESG